MRLLDLDQEGAAEFFALGFAHGVALEALRPQLLDARLDARGEVDAGARFKGDGQGHGVEVDAVLEVPRRRLAVAVDLAADVDELVVDLRAEVLAHGVGHGLPARLVDAVERERHRDAEPPEEHGLAVLEAVPRVLERRHRLRQPARAARGRLADQGAERLHAREHDLRADAVVVGLAADVVHLRHLQIAAADAEDVADPAADAEDVADLDAAPHELRVPGLVRDGRAEERQRVVVADRREQQRVEGVAAASDAAQAPVGGDGERAPAPRAELGERHADARQQLVDLVPARVDVDAQVLARREAALEDDGEAVEPELRALLVLRVVLDEGLLGRALPAVGTRPRVARRTDAGRSLLQVRGALVRAQIAALGLHGDVEALLALRAHERGEQRAEAGLRQIL